MDFIRGFWGKGGERTSEKKEGGEREKMRDGKMKRKKKEKEKAGKESKGSK